MSQAVVLQERMGPALLITLNRPHVLNAIDGELATRLGDLMTTADDDDATRVVVIRGAGRAFCAGADLSCRTPYHADHPEWGLGGFVRRSFRVPVVAAVHGFALGGGAELAAACDLVVAARGTRIGLPEVRRGIVATGGGVLRLPRQFPYRIALELALTGEPVDAEVAAAHGFVNRVVDRADLDATALQLAGQIARNAPLAVRVTKWLASRSAVPDEARLWADNARAFEAVSGSADAAEGRAAFLAKREPVWSGK